MTRKKQKLVNRKGRPITLYLRQEQAQELEAVSRTRHVAKSELIRLGLDRLLDDLRGGQMSLPLGVESLR